MAKGPGELSAEAEASMRAWGVGSRAGEDSSGGGGTAGSIRSRGGRFFVGTESGDGPFDHVVRYPTPRGPEEVDEDALLASRVRGDVDRMGREEEVRRELAALALTSEPREGVRGYLGLAAVRVDAPGLRQVLRDVRRVRPETFSVLQLKALDRDDSDLLLPRVDGWGVEWLTGELAVQWTWAMSTIHHYGSRGELEEACDGEGDEAFVLCDHDDVWSRGTQAAQLDRLEGVQWATLVGGRLSDAEWRGEPGEWVPVNTRALPWISKLGDGAWNRFLCGYLDMAAAIDRVTGW